MSWFKFRCSRVLKFHAFEELSRFFVQIFCWLDDMKFAIFQNWVSKQTKILIQVDKKYRCSDCLKKHTPIPKIIPFFNTFPGQFLRLRLRKIACLINQELRKKQLKLTPEITKLILENNLGRLIGSDLQRYLLLRQKKVCTSRAVKKKWKSVLHFIDSKSAQGSQRICIVTSQKRCPFNTVRPS